MLDTFQRYVSGSDKAVVNRANSVYRQNDKTVTETVEAKQFCRKFAK